MKIKILAKLVDVTFGKIYEASLSDCKTKIIFYDDVGDRRYLYYPNSAFVVVDDNATDEPEQLTLRDQFAMSVIPPAGCTTSKEQAVYRYRTADAMMEARKK